MKKTTLGTIVSDKLDSTAVVEITVWKTHRIFGKRYRQNKKLQVHNPNSEYKLGQIVEIVESRPISKHKSWIIKGLVTNKNAAKPSQTKKQK